MSLRSKVIFILGLFVVLMALVGGLNLGTLHTMMHETIQAIVGQASPALITIGNVQLAGVEMGEEAARYVLMKRAPVVDLAQLYTIQKDYHTSYESVQHDLQLLSNNPMRLFSDEKLTELKTAAQAFYQSGLQVMQENPDERDGHSWDAFQAQELYFSNLLTEISTFQLQELQRRTTAVLQRSHTMVWLYTVAVMLIVILAVGVAIQFWNWQEKRMKAITHMALQLGNGDLQMRIQDGQKDEIGVLADTLNQMAESLAQTRRALEETSKDLALQLEVRQAAEALLAEAAAHDSLTGLPNRATFFEQFNHALALADRNGARMALLFVDMDGLKTVNDAFGHDGGDLLIQQVAQRLRENVRKSDYVARLAGDEFVVILENLNRQEGGVNEVGKKLVMVLAEPYQIRGRRVRLTASIGASLFPEHGHEADELLRRADSAMYQVKHCGKNNFTVYSIDQ